MKLAAIIQIGARRVTMRMITASMLQCTIAAILLTCTLVAIFTYYLSPATAYSQIKPSTSSYPQYPSSLDKNTIGSTSSEQQMQQISQSKVIEASGHFANNQIENDTVSWIQGGLWHLVVYNSSSTSSPVSSQSTNSAKAVFSGNFTMVKPDGTQTHEHSINNFRSNNVIIAGGDMIITGIGNIYENAALKYRQVPITVHLMGKEHVLGVIIDTVKTNRHFVSSHEMFGTLIKGVGLEKIEKTLVTSSRQQQGNKNKGMNMRGMTM
jgi:hypothetical protein